MKFECYNENTNSLENFKLVRDFLRELAIDKLYENWHWARWGWMIGHPNFEDEMLGMIGLWKADNKVVGMAAHDMRERRKSPKGFSKLTLYFLIFILNYFYPLQICHKALF
jgi:hypothetical protein